MMGCSFKLPESIETGVFKRYSVFKRSGFDNFSNLSDNSLTNNPGQI